MYIDFIIKAFLWICCLFSRSSGFRICQSSSSKTEKLSCISRASCAQAPRKQKNAFGWSKEGDQRNLSTQRRRKGRQRIAVKERQKKARSDVMSRSSSSTSSSDSSDWKKVRASALWQESWSLSVFACKFDDCQTSMFFIYEKRRHARKCVIWPILGTYIYIAIYYMRRYIYIYISLYLYISVSINHIKRIDDEVSIQLKPKTSRTQSWSFLLVKKGKFTMINDLNHLNEDFSIEHILFHQFANKKSYMKWYKENL